MLDAVTIARVFDAVNDDKRDGAENRGMALIAVLTDHAGYERRDELSGMWG